MANDTSVARAQWSSRIVFILAASGSAVGLGNIWKFPYVTGVNGGGAFVLVYLVCIACIGIPLLIGEFLIGRRGAGSPTESYARLAQADGRSPRWRWAGALGVLAAFLILSFYSVVGGWCIAYLWEALRGSLSHADPGRVIGVFDALLSSPVQLVFWHTLFMLLTVVVVAEGINRGIERLVKVLMPALFLLLLVLVAYAATTPGFGQALRFLFAPDFSSLTVQAVLVALGHAFFSLSLGMAVMIAYGSFLRRDVSLARAACAIAAIDTMVALLAGVAIFSVVFSHSGLAPGAGPGLVFKTVPLAFNDLPGSQLAAVTFFALLLFAAWSSSVSVLEPVVERFENTRGFGRRRAAWLIAGTTWAIGVLCALSFNLLSEYRLGGKGLFDLLDAFTSTVMLPLAGLGAALFVGWRLSAQALRDELGTSGWVAPWHFLLRYVTPLLITAVFLFNLHELFTS